MRIAGKTDVGRKRALNEDSFFVAKLSDDAAYAVVCDGMGGENGGQVASTNAIDLIRKAMEDGYREEFSETSLKNLMLSAISAANGQIHSLGEKKESLKGMGTTVALVVVRHFLIHIAYAGDSRVYLIDRDASRQLTHDHSMVQMMVDRGEISKEQAQYHPEKHYITKALGVGNRLDADYLVEDMPPGGAVLLCSDGLSNYLDEKDMYRLLQDKQPVEAVEEMVRMANELGGADNITAVLITR